MNLLKILCYKNQGIHWYHCHPSFLWKINFRLVRRLISALIWDISGLWNRSDGQNFREKRIVFPRFLALYIYWIWRSYGGRLLLNVHNRPKSLIWVLMYISAVYLHLDSKLFVYFLNVAQPWVAGSRLKNSIWYFGHFISKLLPIK